MVGRVSRVSRTRTPPISPANRIRALNGKFDTDDVPSMLDVNGNIFVGGFGCGELRRAQEEAERDLRMYGKAFIVVTKSYRVYGLDAKRTADLKDLKEQAKGSSQDAKTARMLVSNITRDIYTV
ncbi:MAG: hypothetical protein WC346_04030 [Methanogenium sp.]